jgi:hypothetical protein
MAAGIVASVLLGPAIWGVPWLSSLRAVLTVAAAVTSLALLVAFWDNHLVFGIALDIALIAVVVLQPEWTAHPAQNGGLAPGCGEPTTLHGGPAPTPPGATHPPEAGTTARSVSPATGRVTGTRWGPTHHT